MNNMILQAGAWGLFSGSALIIGALVGYFTHIPPRLIAGIMAFGSGVLISTLSFELIEEAFQTGGFMATAGGFLVGAIIFTIVNLIISAKGAKHRKRSGTQQREAKEQSGGGMAIAVGALLDGIPESIVIGLSLLHGGKVSMAAVIAIFLSNIPEGLSSAAGMRKAARSKTYIFGMWTVITFILGFASLAGYAVFSHFSPGVNAATMAVAAGAILAMIADTMIPEAFETAHGFTGLITVVGFLTSYVLTKFG